MTNFLVLHYDSSRPLYHLGEDAVCLVKAQTVEQVWQFLVGPDCPDDIFWRVICPGDVPLLSLVQKLELDPEEAAEGISYVNEDEAGDGYDDTDCKRILDAAREMFRNEPTNLMTECHRGLHGHIGVTVLPREPLFSFLNVNTLPRFVL